ncbi:MAG TPA: hypothetical protein VH593_32890 [Ktedonobacteraceae bacterium]|jgi:hypothetical protein
MRRFEEQEPGSHRHWFLLGAGLDIWLACLGYFDERECQQVERRLVHRLESLGYQVALQPTFPPPQPSVA